MSKIQGQSDLSQIKDMENFRVYTSRIISSIVDAVNGNLDFSSNLVVSFANDIVFPVNTTIKISHTLGHVPTGYIAIKNNIPNVNFAVATLPNGGSNFTDKEIYLYTTTSCTASFLIF